MIGLINESVAEIEESERADTNENADLSRRVPDLISGAGVAGTKVTLNFNKPTLRITDDSGSCLY